MKIYIAGPVSGIKDFNEHEFKKAERILREQGHETINPVELCKNAGLTEWNACMNEICIPNLLTCEAIYLLKGYSMSRGATVELKKAIEHGIKQMYQ